MPKTKSYREWHEENLREEHGKDPNYVAGYLSACLKEGEDVFLAALREVADALGGVKELSEATSLNKTTLYRMLSKEGNPTIKTVSSVLHAFGMQLQCVPLQES